MRGKHSSHSSCFCVSKNWLWSLDCLNQSGPKLIISVLFSISYTLQTCIKIWLWVWQLCLTQLILPVIVLNIFQTIVTSITSIRWWKWFMETGQTINVSVTGQIRCMAVLGLDTTCTTSTRAVLEHPAPFLVYETHDIHIWIYTHMCAHQTHSVC